MAELRWAGVWEADVDDDLHVALSRLLRRVFPAFPVFEADGRSWYRARPERRIVGFDGARPVAHLGFARRTFRVHDFALAVADVGLVGVDPDVRGHGLGRRLLASATAELESASVAFGFLTCAPGVVGFYERAGWRSVHGGNVRLIDFDRRPSRPDGPVMVLPVGAPIEDWATDQLIVRDSEGV